MTQAQQTNRVRSRPESFQPPYDAHTTIFPAEWREYVMGQFAVQIAPGADGAETERALDGALAQSPAPLHVERVDTTDAQGCLNKVRMAYWRNAGDYAEWRANPAVTEFLQHTLEGPVGLWREVIVAPADNVDPTGGAARHLWGVGRHLKQVWERYHAYYGSMRDRMPNGRVPEIEGQDITLQPRDNVASEGRRLTVDLPHNLCFIRNVSGWRNCPPEVKRTFIDELLPVYERGARYLCDNPVEVSCISARLCDVVDDDPPTEIDSETLAWFTSLTALEAWTHRHPTHAAIFRKAQEIGMRFGFDAKMDLGHEVVVVPHGGVDTEYNNCHPETGFLRFFPSRIAD